MDLVSERHFPLQCPGRSASAPPAWRRAFRNRPLAPRAAKQTPSHARDAAQESGDIEGAWDGDTCRPADCDFAVASRVDITGSSRIRTADLADTTGLTDFCRGPAPGPLSDSGRQQERNLSIGARCDKESLPPRTPGPITDAPPDDESQITGE